MEEQDESITRRNKVKWSGRKFVLMYWFSLVFIGSAAALGLSKTVLSPSYSIQQEDPHSDITEPWHADDCSPCHDDIIAAWEDTKHSYIIEEFSNASGDYVRHTTDGSEYTLTEWLEGGGCCHKTRWTNDTSVIPSGNLSVWDVGISCAACHIEPGAPYNSSAYGMDPGTMSGFPPTFQKTCAGSCHVPGSRGKTWWQTGHAQSLNDLLATGFEDDSCLHCMTGQGLYNNATELAAYDESIQTPIDCVTCHDPHNVDGYNEHDLRVGSTTELCGTCHVNTYEMITDSTFPMGTDVDCTDCHGYEWVPGHNETDRFGVTTWVDAAFSELQHNWVTPNDADDCGRCHGNDNSTYWDTMQGSLENISLLIKTYQEYYPIVLEKAMEAQGNTSHNITKITNVLELIAEAEALMSFVASDPSNGFHNPPMVEAKVKLALTKLQAAYVEAVDAIENPLPAPRPSPGFEWVGLILVLSMIGTVTILFRKKKR